ncbi:signal peptidase I [Saccharothrix xinjiangensis]|uniref:Signal peptidase I n=1 Tax=Saccharothrix xinjiangensis TaxID=204798 RepID=A0ABV9XSS2_9PSEU
MRGRPVAALLGGGVSLLLVAVLAAVVLAAPVAGDGMNPSLRSGDRVLAFGGTPERLDLVTLRTRGGVTAVRRVVGLPGDEVRITGSQVRVRPAAGEWVAMTPDGNPGVCCAADGRGGTDAVAVVPPDSFFVLGDNPAMSTDSREHGFVPASDVTGVVWRRVWPLPEFGGVASPSLTAVSGP